jgi:serine/threonine protein kinase
MRWLSDDAVAHLRAVTEQPDLSGTRYELVRELGRGGMGVVYEAYDRELARSVALKVLDVATGEARTIAALEHPGIVPVHDSGGLPDGRMYYTMKLVRGERLDAYARNHARGELLRVFSRICEAVAFAHEHHVVHRDLKPENVMVGDLGAVLVMDWGVAARADASDGLVAGTRGYMAPEQERGEPIDARADVHALGAILKDLLRAGGERIPRPLQAVANKAMAVDKTQRYANARELAEDIAAFQDGAPLVAYRENVFEAIGRWAVRYRALIALIAAYLVMRALVLFFF